MHLRHWKINLSHKKPFRWIHIPMMLNIQHFTPDICLVELQQLYLVEVNDSIISESFRSLKLQVLFVSFWHSLVVGGIKLKRHLNNAKDEWTVCAEMAPADVPLSQRETNNKKNSLYLNFLSQWDSVIIYTCDISPSQDTLPNHARIKFSTFFFSMYYDL